MFLDGLSLQSHALANTLKLTEHLLTKFKLRLSCFICATTYTESTALITFEVVNIIAQLPCFANLTALTLIYALDKGHLRFISYSLLSCFCKKFFVYVKL